MFKSLLAHTPLIAVTITFTMFAVLLPVTPAVLLVTAGVLLFLHILKLPKRKAILSIGVVVVSSLCSGLWAANVDRLNESVLTDDTKRIEGAIMDVVSIDGSQVSFLLRSYEGEKIQSFIRLSNEEDLEFWRDDAKPGTRCILEGELRVPSGQRNFSALNYERYLYEQRIHWTMAADHENVVCTHTDRYHSLIIKQWRHYAIQHIEEHFPAGIQGIASALLFGDRSKVEHDILQAYQQLGLVHLLAISGLHIGIVSGIVYFLFIRFGVTRERAAEMMFLLLPLYAVLAGGAPSVVRAVCMSLIVFLAVRFRFHVHPLHTLSAAYILMLCFNPYYIFHVGFQLSFMLTWSIITSIYILRSFQSKTKQSLYVAIVTQVFSFPLIIYYFHSYSLWSLILNIVYVPIISIIVLPAMWVLFFLTLIHHDLAHVWLHLLSKGLGGIHHFFISVQGSVYGTTVFGEVSVTWVIVTTAIAVVLFYLYEIRKHIQLYVGIGVFMLCAAYPIYSKAFDSSVTVTFINVGQGDSILIELPHRQGTYLIDAGGHISFPQEEWQEREVPSDPGRQNVIPYLKARGIQKIDKVIVSHGDYDHIGGLFAVLEEFPVDKMYFPDVDIAEDAERSLITKALDKGVELQLISDGYTWQSREAIFRVLHPGDGPMHNRNDASIVLDAYVGGMRWLFTGDLEEDGEKQVIERYPNLKTDILKAGHHGSRTSTTAVYLEQLNPTVAVISAGVNNRFQHPHDEVVGRLNKEGVRILGTYEHGAIRFTYKNNGWYVETSLVER
ncbi:DNA internalization-related competence protein ComEC/Rec2 [Geomicrobium sp. JSM 1781026]|uniref:DNA internalization-related competence protein ComEC/Rec2 n=1 Tax=Geomicrobium sp. JSM 1781026 TaxID=3344580 RepID=UPI0035C21592